MPHYRDPDGEIHFLDDAQYEHLLPTGSKQITDDEARIMQAPADEQLSVTARAHRDALLTSTEWIVSRHRDEIDTGHGTTLSADHYVALLAYRQALRDVPLQAGFPQTIDWPEPPTITTQSEPLVSST